MKTILLIIAALVISTLLSAQGKKASKIDKSDTLVFNLKGNGNEIIVNFEKGKKFSHPVIAIWLEDMSENYVQTLYVSKSIGKGIFEHGKTDKGMWEPGEKRRPSTLPYWAHKRGIKANDGLFVPDINTQVADAYTGATPYKNFNLQTKTDKVLSGKYRIVFEINEAFDFNDYWHNTRYLDEPEYKTSAQPSIIYAVTIDLSKTGETYWLNPIGHGHYSGKDGSLSTNLETLSTALQLVKRISVTIR